MKKIFVLFISITALSSANCQINNDFIIEQIEKMAEESEEEYSDYSEMIEAYWSIVENPININSDDIDQLAEFKFISIFQLEKIKNYRKNYGDFLYFEELYEVDELDEKSIELIKPLISFENKNISDKIFLKDIFKYGKNKILFEVNQCLNKKKGYEDISDSTLYDNPNSIYLGSPQKIYLRYNFSYKNNIEAGFVLEKDPGEYLFRKNINDSIRKMLGKQCYSGFDYSSFHIFIYNLVFVKALAIGDYKASFGQGLTMGNGMSFVANGESLLRRNKKISASKSANEAYYLRGVASTFKYKNLELSLFYSNKKTDANISTYDTINETPLEITSLQQSGLHRTYNELMDRKVVRQQLYGMNLSYKISNIQIGYTIHKTNLSAELNPESNIYNSFNFRGRNIVNQGIDFYYVLKKTVFYGEAARSDNNGFAYLIGSTFQPAGYIDFTILYRNYAKDYQCLYSNAFSSGSNTKNEKGCYFSSAISIAANWKLINSIDFFNNDFLKNTSHSPSHGYEFDSQLNYTPEKNTLLFIEYRNKQKMKNTSCTDIYQKYLITEKNNMIRLHASYQINDDICLKNRIEYHFNYQEDEKYNSYLIYQDIIFDPPEKTYNIAFRYELFNAEKGSVYAYENDVLYAFAVGGLSGKGIRTYLVGKIKFTKQLQFSGKIGLTFFENKNVIGSGLETIENNWRRDGKLQLVWSF
ncbi:MAG: helix-hairpin-helix domain-containing protein [Bacteroidales bacterium]|nr:helix-hairpin-helix domain-containing protein [Bacteroidales bacterium]